MTTGHEQSPPDEYPLVRRLFVVKLEALNAAQFGLLLDPDFETISSAAASAHPGGG